jgi:C4-dicarboxylate-specific signal transduction histidine kinase
MDQSMRGLDQVALILEDSATSEEKRQLVPAYLRKLDAAADARRERVRGELVRIREAADHVVSIVHAQQEISTSRGLVERVTVGSLLDQSHLLLSASLLRHEIVFSTAGNVEAVVTLDRHRAVQIITNLVANARDALRDARGERSILVNVNADSETISVDVVDTGPGMEADVAARVFEHGYTTKADGHGFGLHASALAAVEMGGELHILPTEAGAHFQLRVPNLAAREAS